MSHSRYIKTIYNGLPSGVWHPGCGPQRHPC